ncbi:hypothetical protein GYMLUDRAFT_109686, partial [Collybiopsis luxurians FD-317 M1]
LFKKFNDEVTARTCYDEVFMSGVLDLLRPIPMKGEIFIVIEGAVPGIYEKRVKLLHVGLAWHGGKVVSILGTRADADSYFQGQDSIGETKVLP